MADIIDLYASFRICPTSEGIRKRSSSLSSSSIRPSSFADSISNLLLRDSICKAKQQRHQIAILTKRRMGGGGTDIRQNIYTKRIRRNMLYDGTAPCDMLYYFQCLSWNEARHHNSHRKKFHHMV